MALNRQSEPEKDVLFVRSCGPNDKDGQHPCAHAFEGWHAAAADGQPECPRDPCLTDLACQAATTGVASEYYETSPYGGLVGGLQEVLKSFQPDLCLCSPQSTALKTALLALDWSSCPIVVHSSLKTIKKDLTVNGRSAPRGGGGV